MAYLLQQLANAVPLAALYAALAFGYAIAFGVTRRPDITYGALFAFAGQMLLLFSDIGYNRLILVLPAALAFGAVLAFVYTLGAGLLIGRSVIQPLAKTSPNTVIVAAFGVLIVLMETASLAMGARPRWLPPFLNAPVVLWNDISFPVTLTEIQLLDTALMSAIVLSGAAVLRYTAWGRIWRAVSESRWPPNCGLSTSRVFLTAYGSATLIATVCGLLSTSYYGTMDFGAGMMFGLKVLLIASVGGYGNPLKSAGGAAALAFAETLWSAYGPLLWRDLMVFTLLVVLLVISRRERVIP